MNPALSILLALLAPAAAGAAVVVLRRKQAAARVLAAGGSLSRDGKTWTQSGGPITASVAANAHLLEAQPVGPGATRTIERAASWPPQTLSGICATAPIFVGGAQAGARRADCSFAQGITLGGLFVETR
jgi:hypothetical protein